jgi:hypothetical protein
MAAGQGIDLAPAARSKLAPSPHGERHRSQENGGQNQGGGLGKNGDGSGRRRHLISLSGRAAT